MADPSNPGKPNRSGRDEPELGVVRIRSSPAPDAQDRLRRLFALLVRYATADGATELHQADTLENSEGERK